MNQQEKEVQKLSKDLKIRNKILEKLLWILYHKPIKFHRRTEEQIWNRIKTMDEDFGYLK